jgi:prolyl 4-hydroxylase
VAVSGLAHKFGYDVVAKSSKREPWADVLTTHALIQERICEQAVCALERLPLHWEPGAVHLGSEAPQIRSVRSVSTIDAEGLPELHDVIASLDRYMSQWMADNQVSLERSPVSILRYEVGGQYAPHRDSGPARPHRVLTVLLYLNADYQGGETVFPDIKSTIAPEPGKMLLFDAKRLHASAPVLAGRKYALVAWFRPRDRMARMITAQ